MHSHCNLSDDATGPLSGPPQVAFAYARDVAGIDVLSLTDHTHYMTPSEYVTLTAVSDSMTQNGVFVGLAGQEHGSLSTSVTGAFGHINVYEAPSLLNQSTLRYNLTATYAYIAGHVNRITGSQLVGTFNHPYSSAGAGEWAQFHDFAWDSTGDEAIELIEVLNGKRSSDYEAEYLEALGKGWHIGALGNQDNHEGSWGDQPNNIGNIPLTGIWAPALTKADILDAIAARRTFAMEVEPATDRISLKLTADGNWMGSEYTTSADSIEFFVDVAGESNVASIALYRNGILLRSTGGGTPSVQWTTYDTPGPGSFYYFVRVTQYDGDRAWSSPVWVESTSSFSLPIASVNQDDVNGYPTMWFQTVRVQGIVTVDTDTLSTVNNQFFLQDPTGGVMVLETGGQTVPVALGDNVLVNGTVDILQGQTMLVAPTITIQSSGSGEPTPVTLTTNDLAVNGEAWEGSLALIPNVAITGGSWPAPGSDGSVTIDDGSGPATLFIDRDTVLDDQGAPAESTFAVKGIVIQQDISAPYTCCWAILPRYGSDIFQVTGVGVTELPLHESVARTTLHPSAPNPFRPSTTVRFDLAGSREQNVLLAVYDVTGRRVRTLVDRALPAGSFEAVWNGDTDRGEQVAAGVYFVRLLTPGKTDSQKIVRLD